MGWICEDQEKCTMTYCYSSQEKSGFPLPASSLEQCSDLLRWQTAKRGSLFWVQSPSTQRLVMCSMDFSLSWHILHNIQKHKTDYWTTRHYVTGQFQVPQSPCPLYAQLSLNCSYHRVSVSDLNEPVVSEAVWTTIGRAKENLDWIQFTLPSCSKQWLLVRLCL